MPCLRILSLLSPCSEVLISAKYGGNRYYLGRGGETKVKRGASKSRFLWQHRMALVSPPVSGARSTLVLHSTSNVASAIFAPWRKQTNNIDPCLGVFLNHQPGKQRWQWKRGIVSVPEHPEPKMGSSDSHSRDGCWSPDEARKVLTKGPLKPGDNNIELVDVESVQHIKEVYEEYKLYETARKNPRKASEQVERSQIMAITQTKKLAMLENIPGVMSNATKAIVLFLLEVIRKPRVLKDHLVKAQRHLVEFVRHYYLGSKLLWNEIKTAKTTIMRITQGHHMTRRERKQLLRTVSDIFRMVPLAAFLIIPFMDFLLPVAVKLFPGMLPSTFQDISKEEDMLKKELRLRIAYAGFLQEAVTVMADKKKNRANDEATIAELTEFIEKAKLEEISNQDIYKFAKMFKDELTLDNISRSGLVNMCRYMGLSGFGSDSFLRFQLRLKLRGITRDDQSILWEGVVNLTKRELQDACRERGMRATGLTKQGYAQQLSQWLELRTKQSVPISLLIMSRAFTLLAPAPSTALAQSISAMDASVLTEVMIDAASGEERETSEHRNKQLESLTRQNKLIDQENKNLDMVKKIHETTKTEISWNADEAQIALDAQAVRIAKGHETRLMQAQREENKSLGASVRDGGQERSESAKKSGFHDEEAGARSRDGRDVFSRVRRTEEGKGSIKKGTTKTRPSRRSSI